MDDSNGGRGIGATPKALFLAALRRGAQREDAAEAAGFSLTGFYGARRRDPAFAAAWRDALAAPPAAGRRVRAYEERAVRLDAGEVRIAAANRRYLQRRRRRHVRFTAGRRDIFLARFAEDCDARAAAAAAGVSESTVHLHRRTDRGFAAAYEEALQLGYARLEAETLRLRLAAQEHMSAAIDAAGPGAPLHDEDDGAEFERAMRLLARADRKPRRIESGFKPGGRRQRWTFEDAIRLLDQRLRGLGLRSDCPPLEGEGEGEGEGAVQGP